MRFFDVLVSSTSPWPATREVEQLVEPQEGTVEQSAASGTIHPSGKLTEVEAISVVGKDSGEDESWPNKEPNHDGEN